MTTAITPSIALILVLASPVAGKIIIFVSIAPPKYFFATNLQIIGREINGQVVFADPLAEDWVGNLITVAHEFDTALR
ncbi:MAG: hypothetical protein PVI13_03980 [Desulfobacterales bacterium]|jgi:hypothetical protein